MIFAPQQVTPFGLAISLQGLNSWDRCAPMRFYMFYVEAKGIEPLLEEPKSSVLPLDDASKK